MQSLYSRFSKEDGNLCSSEYLIIDTYLYNHTHASLHNYLLNFLSISNILSDNEQSLLRIFECKANGL